MKKRSSYRPKPIQKDPMAWVMSGMKSLKNVEGEAVKLKIKNHVAMCNLRDGTANRDTIDVLIAALNITEALASLDVGRDYLHDIRAGMDALHDIAARGLSAGGFKASVPELMALNLAMDIHDAQLDACTVKELEDAIHRVVQLVRCGATRKIMAVAA